MKKRKLKRAECNIRRNERLTEEVTNEELDVGMCVEEQRKTFMMES